TPRRWPLFPSGSRASSPPRAFVKSLVSLNQLRFGSLPSRSLHLASARTHEIAPTAWTRQRHVASLLPAPRVCSSQCANDRGSFPHVRGVVAESKPHCRQIALHREAARTVESHVRAPVPCKHERFVLTPGL